MTDLTNWFASLSLKDPIVWLSAGSGLAVVLVFLFLGRRQRRTAAVIASAAAAAERSDQLNPADIWLPPSKQADERRRSTRRSGVPTHVQISDSKKPRSVIEGYVLDRSSGGLRLAMEKPFTTGSELQVRATNAPPESPWIVIVIRSCREEGDYFEVGCQFTQELPWNLLLMFG